MYPGVRADKLDEVTDSLHLEKGDNHCFWLSNG